MMRAMTTAHIDSPRPGTVSLLHRGIAFFAEREMTFRLFIATAAYPLWLLASVSLGRAWWSWGFSVRVVTMALDVVVASVAIRQLVLERPQLLAVRAEASRVSPDDTLRSLRR